MFYVLQNEAVAARRRCPILLTDSATGTTGQSGIAVSSIYPYVSINGGAFAGGAGTIGAVNFGQYYYEFDASEINTLGLAGIHITAPGCRDYDAIVQVAAFNMYSVAGAGLTAGDVWSYGGGRSITGGIANTVTSVTDPVSVSTVSMTGIANTTWSTDVSAYTSPSAGYDVHNGAAGAGISAYDVWSFDYINAPGGVVPVSAAERLEETRTESYTTSSNTNDISGQVWNTDISANSDPSAGFSLYQLGIGATGYAGAGISAADVWNYDYIVNTPVADTYGYVLATQIPSDIANVPSNTVATVWNENAASYTIPGTMGDYVNQLGTGATGYAGISITAGDVWDYVGGRTITGGIADTVTLVSSPVEISYPSMAGLANTIWSTDVSGYTSPSAGYDLANASSGSGLTAFDVWSYATRTITGGIADTVTDVTNGVIVTTNNDKTGYALSSTQTFDLTGNISGSVGSVTADVNVSTASMTGIANTVWSTLTAPYTTHATFGHQILRSDNAATIGEVTLHQSGGSKRVDADVHAFVNNTASATAMLNILTGIGSSMTTNITGNITGNLSGSVGSVTADVNVSTTSMSGIANTVWSTDISGYTSPSAGFDLSNVAGGGITAGDVWTYATREITGGIADTVTTVSGNVLGSVNSVVTDVTISTGTQASIANSVWSADVSGYASPSAGFDLSNASSGAGLTAGDVWTYATREITGGIADTVTTVTNGVIVTTNNDKTGYALSSTQTFDLTGNITGNLSGSVASVTNAVTFDSAQYSAIASSVWNAGTRTITGGIADTVTTVTNGVIVTTNNDKTGYDLSSTQTFDVTGNITGNLSGSVGSVTNAVTFDSAQYAGIASSVWNAATRTLTSVGSGISAYDVWNFDPTAMTSPQAGAILTDIGTDTNTIITDIGNVPNNVWASDVSGYSTPGEAGFELSQAAAGAGLTAGDVWTYASRTITGGIADTVTTLTNKSGFAITGGTVDTVTNGVTVSTNNDKTGYSLSGTQTFNVTGNITGNVSGSVGSVSGAVGSVTGNVGGNVVGSVDSVTNPVTFNSGQYASIASSVWNAGTRTLTSSGSGISAYDVWNFVLSDSNTAEVDLVQAAAGSGLTAGDVWTYGTRTITGGIADTVTTVTNGVTVTTNNDKTGYALSGAGVSAVQSGLSTLTSAQVGTEVDSSLSDVGLTTTVTGRIDVAVSSRLASASYVAPPTEAAIAGTVWGYATRTLTSGAGATAGDVWTYGTRTLTSGAGITVNAATNIINGPYFVKSNVDSQDGTLDVIRDMVQDIQLTVTDANGNPFDTTALGLAVNFYDQAGTLTTSYATTQLYGPAGLVQFTLNTAVTANEGRYNLILSAAGSGNTIKFGPLQTLVRPF